jgi:hypothetical protein
MLEWDTRENAKNALLNRLKRTFRRSLQTPENSPKMPLAVVTDNR